MKHVKTAAILMALALLLAGCGDTSRGGKAKNPGKRDGTSAAEKVYDDSLIEEIFLEGDYGEADPDGRLHYSYHIPAIKDDSPSAAEFNASMEELAASANDPADICYGEISWESHWNGSLLSLLVKMERAYVAECDYSVYNYDFELGKFLTNKELLSRIGRSGEEAETALRREAAGRFDKDAETLPVMYGGCFAEISELRAETISKSNLSMDNAGLFLGEEGKLRCRAFIGTPAGSGRYSAMLCLDRQPEKNKLKQSECDFMKAEIKEDGVYLSFEDTELAKTFFCDSFPEFGKAYKIEGLYGSYEDIAVSFAGNGGDAFLFVIDTERCISFCDIMSCVKCGRFFAAGPLPAPIFADRCEIESDEYGTCVYAVCDGVRRDLYEAVLSAEQDLPWVLEESSWLSESGDITLGIGGESDSMNWNGESVSASGPAPKYIGMTEEGMHFLFSLASEDGSFAEGCLSVPRFGFEREGEASDSLVFTQCPGTPLFASSAPSTVFVRAPEY